MQNPDTVLHPGSVGGRRSGLLRRWLSLVRAVLERSMAHVGVLFAPPEERPLLGFVFGATLIALLTGALNQDNLAPHAGHGLALLYLLPVLFASTMGGQLAGVIISLLAVATWDWYFTPPRFSLGVATAADTIAVIVFLVVGMLVGRLSSALRHRTAEAVHRTRELSVAEERNRIARDLHDSVTQSLYAISLESEVLKRTVLSANTRESERRADQLRNTALNALGEMRLLLSHLRPAVSQTAPLDSALRTRLLSVENRIPGLVVSYELDGDIHLSTIQQDTLFRIAQEALNNVVRHSAAQHLHVSLRGNEDIVFLSIRDDGRGFEPSSLAPSGLGLQIMAERAAEMGAVLVLSSTPGSGTAINVEVAA